MLDFEALISLDPSLLPSIEDVDCILHKCAMAKEPMHALCLHVCLCNYGIETWPSLGNHLVSSLADIGKLPYAHRLFNRLPYQNECSWNSLITGYVKFQNPQLAFGFYEQLQKHESMNPHRRTFIALLKVCAKLKDLERGLQIHGHIAKIGSLEKDLVLGSTLVCMYAKCGLFTKAHEVFDRLPVQNAVSWTAMVGGYLENGYGEEALQFFEQMHCESVLPDAVTLSCSLKACGIVGAIYKGRTIHAGIEGRGLLETDPILGNALVNMYAKSGDLAMAQQVFTKLSVRDAVSWTSLISGYAEQGFVLEALKCFEQMRHEGVAQDEVTLVCTLKACGSVGAVDKVKEICAEIERRGLWGTELVLGNTMLDMYAKCGLLANADHLFDKLLIRDVISWNTLITGYVERGHGGKALNCFEHMQFEGVHPNAGTFSCTLNACGMLRVIDKGLALHAQIERLGRLGKNLVIGNSLVDMYAKCGRLTIAQEVFDKLPIQSIISWTALIAGYAEHGHEVEALKCFEQMQYHGFSPNPVTFVCILKACSSISASCGIRDVHDEIERQGLLESNLGIGTSVVDAYAKCGLLSVAREVFDRLSVRNVVTWNALIAGYAEYWHGKQAIECFEMMQLEGVCPDDVTYICSLNVCGIVGATKKGMELHAELDRRGLLKEDLAILNTVIDMYVNFGLLSVAQQVFDKLPVRDVVSWTTLITGYSENGLDEVALKCFEQMQQERISANSVTLICVLKACRTIGALDKAKEVHIEIEQKGFLEYDLVVGNTLVEMYAKSGLLAKAQHVFEELPLHHVVAWTTLMAGYAQLGEIKHVFHLFERMLGEGIMPDPVIFVVVLNACSHTGHYDKGQTYFEKMHSDYGIIPACEHHACMIDLLSRVGQFHKAVSSMEQMNFHFDNVFQHIVLSACRSYMELGRHFEYVVHVHKDELL